MSTNGKFAIVSDYPAGSSFVEAFGLLSASLVLQNGSKTLGMVCIVGANAGDGVTTTALNLGIAAAQAGRFTMLVDANLREPALHRAFDLPSGPGLADVLAGKSQVEDAIRLSSMVSLSVIPGGTANGSVLSLLQPDRLAAVFGELRKRSGFVVVDTPPAFRYPDALHLGRLTDGAILVLPAYGAQRQSEVEVRKRLERVQVTIRGIVLNKSSTQAVVRQ